MAVTPRVTFVSRGLQRGWECAFRLESNAASDMHYLRGYAAVLSVGYRHSRLTLARDRSVMPTATTSAPLRGKLGEVGGCEAERQAANGNQCRKR